MMKKLTLAVTLVAAIGSVQNASAATTDYYVFSGNSCVSATPGLVPMNTQWGIKGPGTSMEVVCPIALPPKAYTTLGIYLSGYNRQTSENLNCNVSTSDYSGATFHQKNYALRLNQGPVQTIAGSMNLGQFEYFISIKCYLPRGENYLSSMQVLATY